MASSPSASDPHFAISPPFCLSPSLVTHVHINLCTNLLLPALCSVVSSLPSSSLPSLLIIHESMRSHLISSNSNSSNSNADSHSPLASAQIKLCASNLDVAKCLCILPSFKGESKGDKSGWSNVIVVPQPAPRHGKDHTMRMLASLCAVNQGGRGGGGGGQGCVLVDASGRGEGEVEAGMGVENVVVFGEGGTTAVV